MESITNPTTTLTLETYNEMCEQIVKQHKELRKTKYALWIARAERAKAEQWIWSTLAKDNYTEAWRRDALLRKHKWKRVEHLCREKAKEYE